MAAGQPRPSLSLEDLQDPEAKKHCRQRSLPSLLLLTLGPGGVLILCGEQGAWEMRLRSCTPALYPINRLRLCSSASLDLCHLPQGQVDSAIYPERLAGWQATGISLNPVPVLKTQRRKPLDY